MSALQTPPYRIQILLLFVGHLEAMRTWGGRIPTASFFPSPFTRVSAPYRPQATPLLIPNRRGDEPFLCLMDRHSYSDTLASPPLTIMQPYVAPCFGLGVHEDTPKKIE